MSRIPLVLCFISAVLAESPSRCDLRVQPPHRTDRSKFSFPSIDAARRALRGVESVFRATSGPTVVCIEAGTYNEVLHFDGLDSGLDAASPIIYVGDGNVSLSGATPLSFGPLPADDPARAVLPPSVAASVFVAAVPVSVPSSAFPFPPRGFGPYGGCAVSPAELISGGGALQTASRWPNVGDASQGTAAGFALSSWWAPTGGLSNGSMYVPSSAPFLPLAGANGTASGGNLQLHAFFHFEWADGFTDVGSAAPAEGGDNVTLVQLPGLTTPGTYTQVTGAARYYAVNALALLDAPGEYFINATSRSLYWWPPGGAADLPNASLTTNVTLLSLEGASHVVFAGVTVEGARGVGVSLSGCADVALLNLTLRNLGQDAISVSASNGTLVSRVDIHDIGGGGVNFQGGGDRLTLTPSGNVVVDSVITRVERACLTYNPAVYLDTGGVAAHNDISDAPHFGVSLAGNDALIIGNVIHNVSRITFDNAAVYWYPTDWSARNATIELNFFYGNGQDATTCNARTSCNRDVVYTDNGSAAPNVTRNVMWHPRGAFIDCPFCQNPALIISSAFFQDGTRESSFSNNILILDGSNGTFTNSAGITWDVAQQGNSSAYIDKLHAVNWSSGIYAERYPALAKLQDFWPTGGDQECATEPSCGPAPFGCVFTTNVLVNGSSICDCTAPPWAWTPAMSNMSNNLVTDDPGWAVPDPREALNFQLAPSSPAYAMGFQRIPTECIGVGLRCPGEPDWGADTLVRIDAALYGQ